MRQACSLCLYRTFSKCCNKTCTTAVCGVCKEKKHYLCKSCKENGVDFQWRNKLRGARKRKDIPDLEVDHSAAKRRTIPIGEEVSEEQNEPIEMEESDIEEEEEPEPESQENIRGVQCENCKGSFGRLMYHLKKTDHENCLNYYFAKYNCDGLENLMKKMKNENRKKARQIQGRDRTREVELRRQGKESLIMQANAYNKECHSILSVPCVSCGCVPNNGLQVIEVASVAEEVNHENLQTYQVDGQVFICKICDKILKNKERKDSLYDCLSDLAEVAEGAEVFSALSFSLRKTVK